MKNIRDTVLEAHRRLYGEPTKLVRAPGRVNLIGEHTDYNEGFVLPAAIDRSVWIALSERPESRVELHSLEHNESVELSLLALDKEGPDWSRYLGGMIWTLGNSGATLNGFRGVVGGDVPLGAGLSSSAAFEMAIARAFFSLNGAFWRPDRMALLGQQCENDWVGVNCGIMDQLVSAAGEADAALLIDCRTLETESVPIPSDAAIVIMDTNTRRGLVDSKYNERREQCEQVAEHFAARALRDVDEEDLAGAESELDPVAFRRARHVVSENARVLQAANALRSEDLVEFGRLMNASHFSLRDDFEVSTAELDAIADTARNTPGCFGARMTGAGFGGCAVALVDRSATAAFCDTVSVAYKQTVGLDATLYICRPSAGASEEPIA